MRSAVINKGNQAGTSLIEAVIGLAISLVVMLAMLNFSAESEADMRGKNMAESMQAFQQAASQYFIANRTEMMDAMVNTSSAVNANKHCKIDVAADGSGGEVKVDPTTRLTCMLDASLLAARGALPQGVATNNQFRQPWIAVFRRIKDGGGTPTNAVDLLIVGTRAASGAGVDMSNRESRVAAEIAGGNGGAVFSTDQPGCTSVQACGNGGGWLVPLSDFGLSK